MIRGFFPNPTGFISIRVTVMLVFVARRKNIRRRRVNTELARTAISPTLAATSMPPGPGTSPPPQPATRSIF
jgi:hypothetical protein